MATGSRIQRVCLIPNVSGVGGMVSFRGRLASGLAKRKVEVSFSLDDGPYQTVLVIGGTHDLAGLWRARRRGARILQRLDGMNWIHRRTPTGWRHYARAEYGNLILSLIRSRLADGVIYQSEFSRQWWERVYGKTRTPFWVVHNGVDLEQFTPNGAGGIPVDRVRLLLVEGTIGGGYELGLATAIDLAAKLQAGNDRQVEVRVVGRIAKAVQPRYAYASGLEVSYLGQVPGERIPELDRSAHVLYAADLNPACPNAVIEALACGLPVAGFDTGALGEIVTDGAGELVAYGGDPWKLDQPDIEGLAAAVKQMVENRGRYRAAARARAEAGFSLERMLDGYLEAFAG